MKIFLDTADTQAIKKWKETGLIDGVTTNPTHLSKAGGNPMQHIQEICALLPHGEISVEVTETNPDAVYKQAKSIAKINSNVLVKIPCHADYYQIINQLVKDTIPLNITLVFTLLQSLMMCKLGVRYISPFLGRWDDIDVESITILEEIREMVDTYCYETQILAASIRTVRQFHNVAIAGADAVTLPIDVLEKSTQHVLTDQGIEKFNEDWKKVNSKTFPR